MSVMCLVVLSVLLAFARNIAGNMFLYSSGDEFNGAWLMTWLQIGDIIISYILLLLLILMPYRKTSSTCGSTGAVRDQIGREVAGYNHKVAGLNSAHRTIVYQTNDMYIFT